MEEYKMNDILNFDELATWFSAQGYNVIFEEIGEDGVRWFSITGLKTNDDSADIRIRFSEKENYQALTM